MKLLSGEASDDSDDDVGLFGSSSVSRGRKSGTAELQRLVLFWLQISYYIPC
jgi:hypothetical protein